MLKYLSNRIVNVATFNYVTGAGATVYLYQYEVDGELLVDAGFGGNGFYLPFNLLRLNLLILTDEYLLSMTIQLVLMQEL